MIDELQRKIDETQLIMEERRTEAEQATEAFLSAVAQQLAGSIPTAVRVIVEREHEVTKKMGAEKVGQLKQELAKLTDGMLPLVRAWIGTDNWWAHRKGWRYPKGGNTPSLDYSYTRDLEKRLDETIQTHMVAFMKKYGYTVSEWSDGHAYFRLKVAWEEFKPALAEYGKRYKTWDAANKEFESAMDAKGRHEASSIWDKAGA